MCRPLPCRRTLASASNGAARLDVADCEQSSAVRTTQAADLQAHLGGHATRQDTSESDQESAEQCCEAHAGR